MFTNCQGSKGKSTPLGVCLRQTTQVKHGEVAFATAMRPSIDSDGERLATQSSLLWVKLRRTHDEQMYSGSRLKADFAKAGYSVDGEPLLGVKAQSRPNALKNSGLHGNVLDRRRRRIEQSGLFQTKATPVVPTSRLARQVI
jgi:hypothetical protein